MKNKKKFYVVGLLVFVLVLGIGYAAVSTVGLNIDGTASVKSENLNVSFNGVTEVSDEEKVVANSTDNSLDATISVSDLTLNEIVTATYTIKNEETDVNANITKKTITNDKEEFFEVTTSVDESPTTVDANGTAKVTVTVKLIKTPIEADDSTANIQIDLDANPVQQ